MDWNITCDDLSAPFEPTEADWLEDDEAELSDLLEACDLDFFEWVDSLNN